MKTSGARAAWKAHYRMLRVARRECARALNDLICYGTSTIFISRHGDPKHIPISAFLTDAV